MPMLPNGRLAGPQKPFPLICLLPVVFLFFAGPLFGQQDYVARFDAYGGYAFLDSPHVRLFEDGFATQVVVRAKRWISFGFDYSRTSGDLSIVPDLLLPSLQQS